MVISLRAKADDSSLLWHRIIPQYVSEYFQIGVMREMLISLLHMHTHTCVSIYKIVIMDSNNCIKNKIYSFK